MQPYGEKSQNIRLRCLEHRCVYVAMLFCLHELSDKALVAYAACSIYLVDAVIQYLQLGGNQQEPD